MNLHRDRLIDFVNSKKLDHELMVVTVSYLFVFAGAWDDGIIGLAPSFWSRVLEWTIAAFLFLEILSRVFYTREKSLGHYLLLSFDVVSLATLVPGLTGVALFRLARLLYASWRTIRLIDSAAREHRRPVYLLNVYPLVVPLVAALLYSVERESTHPGVGTYFEALGMCFGFALTLGNSRPSTYVGNLICGALFVGGILCIGIIANSLTDRYSTHG